MMHSIQCEKCDSIILVNSLVWKARRAPGLPYPCEVCGGNLYVFGAQVKRGKTDNQKRSRKQEKVSAKRYGGRMQPASGAGRAKGDIRRMGDMVVECKLTRSKSFSLKLAELEKIESEVILPEKPIFEIEFQGVTPHKRYAVIPGWLLDHFLSLEDE